MSTEIRDIGIVPVYVYDDEGNPQSLRGWNVQWKEVYPEFGCLETVEPQSRYFEKGWLFGRHRYKKVCEFYCDLLAQQNENTK